MVMRACAVIVLCFVGVLAGACGDYEIPLRHGYFVARTSSDEFALVAPDHHVVIGPTIKEFHVYRDIVVGRVYGSEGDEFFIVDMKDGRAERGLAEHEWRKRLEARGISAPHLSKPNRWQKIIPSAYSDH
jgi:hypothetical protein